MSSTQNGSCVLVSLFNYDSFSMRMLYAYLERKGIPVYFLAFKRMKQKPTRTLKNDYIELHDYHDEVTEEDISTLLATLKELSPLIISFHVQSSHYHLATELTQRIKAEMGVPVIWGGAHPTIVPENCIKEADMICIGEGFDPLADVYASIKNGTGCDAIQNIWVRHGDKIIRNAVRPLIKDLDILPFASFSPENKIYIDEGNVQKAKNIDYFGFGFTDDPLKTIHQTMTSFGCPFHCSFCINSLAHDKYRRRSPRHVIQELIAVKQKNKGLKMVFFWDNILVVDKKWCFEFAELYKKEISLPFFAYSHPLYTDRQVFRALREAGWAITVMGIQSGCARIRKNVYARSETDEQIIEAAKRLKELYKVKSPRGYFRIYYDYVKNNPLEGKDDLHKSLDLFLRFPKGFIFQAFNLSFFPNYPITKYFLEHGIISEKDIEGGTEGTSGSNWTTTFDPKKEYKGFLQRHEYYYLLFSLSQYTFFPNAWIRFIESRKLFMNRLSVLYMICRVVRAFELTFSRSNLLWLWEVSRFIPLGMKIRKRVFARYK